VVSAAFTLPVKSRTQKVAGLAKETEEKPRGILFHWVANMFFASLALAGGILFGERVPESKLGLLPILVPAVGLALIPLTRRWERMGIERRKAEGKSKPANPKGRPK
jgi:hypothetical protein